MRRPHAYRHQTLDAAKILGLQIARERRRRRMPVGELYERSQISAVTLRKVERGDPSVAIGIFFEVATVLGIVLYAEPDELTSIVGRLKDKIMLMPARFPEARTEAGDDDF